MDAEYLRVGLVGRNNSDRRGYKILMNVAGDSRDYAIDPRQIRLVARVLTRGLDVKVTEQDAPAVGDRSR